jgi:alpha-tubulin suppressor-like RCC1 family protein
MRFLRRGTLVSALSVTLLGAAISPTIAAPLKEIAQVAAGDGHVCARLVGGAERCWGTGFYGALGNGSVSDAGSPVSVRNMAGTGLLGGVTSIGMGSDHSCAVLGTGQLRCWGFNGTGQLGDGTTDGRVYPVAVSNGAGTGPLRRVKAVAAGSGHTCALLRSGRVRCWGNNTDGQLGDGTRDDRLRPVAVRGPNGIGQLEGVVEIDAGLQHTCARLGSGQVRCWGAGSNGALGYGGSVDRLVPVLVRSVSGPGRLGGVTHVDVGDYHSCASLLSGEVRCWGENGNGELGDGTTQNRARPVQVRAVSGAGALREVADVAAGGSHSCALLTSGQARCWGDADDGQLGNGTPTDYRARPVVVRASSGDRLRGVRQLTVGFAFTCSRMRNTTGRCWGANDRGQLGDGTFAQSDVPVIVVQ